MEGLKRYIAKHRMLKYELGQNDCNLFISRWHDKRYKTNTTKDIEGKYWDKESAQKYLEETDNTIDWLQRMGYRESRLIADGDVLTSGHEDVVEEGFITPFLFLNGLAYTTGKNGLIGIKPSRITKPTVWRAP
jgi:hypothetical protein